MTQPRRLALALVCLLALGANIQALDNTFAMDDRFIVLENERIQELDSVGDALTMPYWPHTVGYLAMYRPVTSTALALQWRAWQDHPAGYHAVNLALHVLASALVFLLLAALVPGVAAPLAGGALWAVHPVHVEAVAGIVGLGEILAAVFVLAAALVYLRDGRGWGAAAAIGGLYLLALGAKEIGATLPGLLMVLEAGRRRMPTASEAGGVEAGGEGDGDDGTGQVPGEVPGQGGALPAARPRWLGAWLRRLLERWPAYVAMAIALPVYVALRTTALGTAVGSAQASFFAGIGFGEQLLTAVSIWPEYLRLMLFPVDLVADYSPAVLTLVTDVLDPRFIVGLLVGVVAVLIVWRAWFQERSIALGVLWFAVAVLPVSNLIITIGVLLAERTLYLPSVGLALAVAGVVGWAWRGLPRRRAAVAGVVVVATLLMGYRTWLRTPEWESSDTIMATLVRDHPESFRSQWHVAGRLFTAGRTEEALELYRNALELFPDHYQLLLDYGKASLAVGHYEEAVESFDAAARAIPDLPEARVLHMAALIAADRPAEAVDVGIDARQRFPGHRGIYHQAAIALTLTGDYEDALEARRSSIRIGGERAAHDQFVHEAELLLRLGRVEEAREALGTARERAGDGATVPSLDALAGAIESANTAVLPYR